MSPTSSNSHSGTATKGKSGGGGRGVGGLRGGRGGSTNTALGASASPGVSRIQEITALLSRLAEDEQLVAKGSPATLVDMLQHALQHT